MDPHVRGPSLGRLRKTFTAPSSTCEWIWESRARFRLSRHPTRDPCSIAPRRRNRIRGTKRKWPRKCSVRANGLCASATAQSIRVRVVTQILFGDRIPEAGASTGGSAGRAWRQRYCLRACRHRRGAGAVRKPAHDRAPDRGQRRQRVRGRCLHQPRISPGTTGPPPLPGRRGPPRQRFFLLNRPVQDERAFHRSTTWRSAEPSVPPRNGPAARVRARTRENSFINHQNDRLAPPSQRRHWRTRLPALRRGARHRRSGAVPRPTGAGSPPSGLRRSIRSASGDRQGPCRGESLDPFRRWSLAPWPRVRP